MKKNKMYTIKYKTHFKRVYKYTCLCIMYLYLKYFCLPFQNCSKLFF